MKLNLFKHEADQRCASNKVACICSLPFGHEGYHVCECESSWDDSGKVIKLPQVVVEEGGPLPLGYRYFGDKEE